jgi:hypothetical protein
MKTEPHTVFETQLHAERVAKAWNDKHREGKTWHQWTQWAIAENPISMRDKWLVRIVHDKQNYHIKFL